MNHPIYTISIEHNGDFLLKNKVENQELLQIPTKDIHCLHLLKLTGKTKNNIHRLKEQSFCFQMIKNHELLKLTQLTKFTEYFDIIERNDYVICTLKVNLDCTLETTIKNYPNISESTYENLICVKKNTNSVLFINLDYIYDITVEPNITVHPFNHLFSFKNVQSSFVYEPSLLNKLNEYIVQVTLDNCILYLGNIQEFNLLLTNQIKKSRHIQKSQNTMKNLIMIQEKLDILLKLEEQRLFK